MRLKNEEISKKSKINEKNISNGNHNNQKTDLNEGQNNSEEEEEEEEEDFFNFDWKSKNFT
jgi:hypothetical protein